MIGRSFENSLGSKMSQFEVDQILQKNKVKNHVTKYALEPKYIICWH